MCFLTWHTVFSSPHGSYFTLSIASRPWLRVRAAAVSCPLIRRSRAAAVSGRVTLSSSHVCAQFCARRAARLAPRYHLAPWVYIIIKWIGKAMGKAILHVLQTYCLGPNGHSYSFCGQMAIRIPFVARRPFLFLVTSVLLHSTQVTPQPCYLIQCNMVGEELFPKFF